MDYTAKVTTGTWSSTSSGYSAASAYTTGMWHTAGGKAFGAFPHAVIPANTGTGHTNVTIVPNEGTSLTCWGFRLHL